MKKMIIILGICMSIISCSTTELEDELINAIIYDLDIDIDYPIVFEDNMTNIEKLYIIDSLLDVRYTQEDFSAYLCSHRVRGIEYQDSLTIKAGLLVDDSIPKDIKIYYREKLIIEDVFCSQGFKVFFKPEALGRDSIFVNIRVNEKDYADYLYFEVVE